MEKIKKMRGISIILMFIMVFQLIIPVNFAYGDDKNITLDVINNGTLNGTVKIFDPDTGNEITKSSDGTYKDVPLNAVFKINYNFEIPYGDGIEYESGSYIEIKIPEQLSFEPPFNSQILDAEGVLIANYEIVGSNIKITFTDYISENSNVKGKFNLEGTLNKSKVNPGDSKDIVIDNIATIKINVEKNEPPAVGAGIEKSGEYDHTTGQITWTLIVTAPEEGLDNVKIVDKFGSNQEYVENSFSDVTSGAAVVVTGTAIEVDGNTITYIAGSISGVKTYEFKTEPTSNAFSSETGADEDSDAVKFINNVDVFVDDVKTDSDNASVSIDWIEKFGAFNKTEGEIEWTIRVNKDKYKLEDVKIVDIVKKGLTYVGSSAVIYRGGNIDSITPTIDNDGENKKLTFNVGELNNVEGVIKYKTSVDNYEGYLKNNEGLNFSNEAKLTWKDNKFGMPGDKYTVGVIGKGGILNKHAQAERIYNDGNDVIVWTVQVNRNGAALTDSVYFTDEIPDGLSYVENTLKVKTPTTESLSDIIENIYYNEATNILSFTFKAGALNKKTYEIQYNTKVSDKTKLFTNGNVNFTNSATVSGSAIVIKDVEKATQTFKSQVIDKKDVSYNYETGEVKWEIVINRNNLSLPNAVLTDELPEGLEYVGPSTITTTGSAIQITPVINGNTLTYNLGTINEQCTITIMTKVTKEALEKQGTGTNKVLTFENTATIGADGFSPKSDTGKVTVKNPIVGKAGVAINDYVKWTVDINANSITLNNLVLSDKLNDYFTLDVDSFRLYKAKLKTSGNINLVQDGSDSLIPNTKYKVSYDTDNNTFAVSFEENGNPYIVNTPYILEFVTSVSPNAAGQNITNQVTINGTGIDGGNAGNEISVKVFEDESDGSGETGKITIIKADEDNDTNKLGGAKFNIYNIKKDGSKALDATVSTSSDGKVTFTRSGNSGTTSTDTSDDIGIIELENLLYKTHYIEEITAPDGYLKNKVGIPPITLTDDSNERTITITNKKIVGNIIFTKLDGDGNALNGATFELFNESDINFEHPIGSYVSGHGGLDGVVRFENLSAGNYKIKEKLSPVGYEVSNKIIDAVVGRTPDQTDVLVTLTIDGNDIGSGFINGLAPVYGNIELHKSGLIEYKDGTKEKIDDLAGAVFSLEDISGNSVTDKNGNHVGNATSNVDGKVEFKDIPEGDYVIKEVSSPFGYTKSNLEVNVNITRDANKLDNTIVTYSIGTEPYTDIVREVENKSINIEFTKEDGTDNPLEGAEFTLYEEGDEINAFENRAPEKSNAQGRVVFTGVPSGNYIIKETKAPSGYRDFSGSIKVSVVVTPDGTVATVAFSEGASTVNGGMDFENEISSGSFDDLTVINERRPSTPGEPTPVFGKIIIKKTDDDKILLSGAEFTLYDEDGKVVDRGVTGSDGTLTFNDLEPGRYVLKETKAPEGYVLEVDETNVTVVANRTNTYTFTNKKEEPKKPGRIDVVKVDEEGTMLSDAWFSLIDSNGTTLQNAVTINGRASFEDVPVGRYKVEEVQAPEGYELTSQTVNVTVDSEETVTLRFVNKKSGVTVTPVSGRITINKVDGDNAPLAGAEFTLYNENNEIVGTAVSDASGRVVFDNLSDGRYFVKETEAPAGYRLVSDSLTVNVAGGSSNSYRFRNVPDTEDIGDPDIPLGWEEIEDPDVPRDGLPNTGSLLDTWLLITTGLMLIFAGMLLYRRKPINN
ncbi:SpaA isopeptide-forming pilin-related protein [Sedimentibacter sp.]|uniref:SpaA isopeptide-forming pilin-related protein n=1 Tax=Sedimentibacter sp. TaxID=1960295 RepID=UPI00289F435E|nr:SpaA isopeptide-forming pilin-related protein [Sedimentibacter sp.]